MFAGLAIEKSGWAWEKIWQTIMFTILRFIGVGVETEVETSTGRIDAVIETGTHFYIVEVKLDKPVEEAIKQIRKMKYAQKYMGEGKQVVLVGVSFSSETRGIEKWKAVKVKSRLRRDDESAGIGLVKRASSQVRCMFH